MDEDLVIRRLDTAKATMDKNHAEKFIRAWGVYEQGRSDGFAQAVEMVEKLLGHSEIAAPQRQLLLDSLLATKPRISAPKLLPR
jgi:hypothetical protein